MPLANGYISKFSIFDLLIQSRTVLMTVLISAGNSQCGATAGEITPAWNYCC